MAAGSLPARFWSTGGPYRPASSPRRPEAQAPLGLQHRSPGAAGEDRPDRPVLGVLLAQGPQRPPPRRTSPLCCCCQGSRRVFFDVGLGEMVLVPGVAGRRVGLGSGVACPKSWRWGCEPAALESESFPGCPPGPFAAAVAVACRASAWRRAKTASLIRRLRHRSASLWVLPSAIL